MKNKKGITLVSLVIYVLVMLIVITIMSSIIANFYDNNQDVNTDTENIVEFNKFNIYFLREIKKTGIKIDTINTEKGYVLFSNGNSFSFSNQGIYYNNTPICENVNEFIVSKGTDFEGNDSDDIISVRIRIDDFEKTINYKVEEIY